MSRSKPKSSDDVAGTAKKHQAIMMETKVKIIETVGQDEKMGDVICSYNTDCSTTSEQFSLVTQSCPALCDHMNCSTPGLPVHHQLSEFTQTHVH